MVDGRILLSLGGVKLRCPQWCRYVFANAPAIRLALDEVVLVRGIGENLAGPRVVDDVQTWHHWKA